MIHYELHTGQVPTDRLDALFDLHFQLFSGDRREDLEAEMAAMPQLLVLLALDKELLVGYKLGHPRKPGHFYSWLGGVHPNYRQRGIASTLMQRQHAWCREQGYHTIRTQTMNRWRAMLILNLRHGFDIVGLISRAEPVLILEKKLLSTGA
ncbi:GNAT family N-acetyltransferase [Rhabdobacter roseus]|uniref:Putative GNAT superfamily acetyltransferase n=1 Tax=Rhabdobacter roseus TaxID=1655419 RepID=A0A840TWY6_9BACT|nr:GNAT family N-acetyltransferase [Rhabdobacter roseus]MBB5286097.1 putative GNAT superfamily acetyltransferase [Rhabdobacter roseus]